MKVFDSSRSRCLSVWVSGCLGVWVSGCLGVSACVGVSVSRCLGVSVSRCLSVWVSLCLAVSGRYWRLGRYWRSSDRRRRSRGWTEAAGTFGFLGSSSSSLVGLFLSRGSRALSLGRFSPFCGQLATSCLLRAFTPSLGPCNRQPKTKRPATNSLHCKPDGVECCRGPRTPGT